MIKIHYNVILNGDSPLLKAETIKSICENFKKENNELQITSIIKPNPHGSGRIIKDANGHFSKIVEEKDCNDNQRLIKEVNIGIYIGHTETLQKYIPLIKNENTQNEYYLTDIVQIYLKNESKIVGLITLPESKLVEIANVNTTEQLKFLQTN
jgi:bifunctional UDP-N-acetylglucosamine pyrophosphorylase/glucosamine-1-phosphate N-acetyltransferase